MLTEEAFDIICDDLEYKACELFLNAKSETETGFLKNIKSKADDNNIKIAAVHPFTSGCEPMLFFSEYKRRTYDSIKAYGMFFEAARFLGADYVIFHGLGPRELKMPLDEYAGIFMLISQEAKRYGVGLLHENVGTVNNYAEKLIKIAPDMRFTLDFKHAVTRGFDICGLIDILGKNIAHVHLNDMFMPGLIPDTAENFAKTELCRLPFYGSLNYPEIFKRLAGINYIGCYITEVYRYNYADYSELAESKSKIQAALEFF
jgi:sugar phosphate isomerase/epimerase